MPWPSLPFAAWPQGCTGDSCSPDPLAALENTTTWRKATLKVSTGMPVLHQEHLDPRGGASPGEEYLRVKPYRLSTWAHPTLTWSQSSRQPLCGCLSFQPHPGNLTMRGTPSQLEGGQAISVYFSGLNSSVWNSPGWASATAPGQSPFKNLRAIGLAKTSLSFNNLKLTCGHTHLKPG